MNGRTGHSTGLVCKNKFSPVDVNLHSRDRVNQRQGIRTTCFRCTRHLCDVCDIRTQFHDHRLFCILFHFLCDCFYRFRILSKSNSTLFYVRAGNIDFQHVHRLFCQPFYHFHIFLCRVSAYVYNNFSIIFFQEWNISLTEQINSRILQSHGVEHPAIDFCHTRSRISRPRYICHTFGNHRTKPV